MCLHVRVGLYVFWVLAHECLRAGACVRFCVLVCAWVWAYVLTYVMHVLESFCTTVSLRARCCLYFPSADVYAFGVEGMRAVAGILQQDFANWQAQRVRASGGSSPAGPAPRAAPPAPVPPAPIAALLARVRAVVGKMILDAPHVSTS